MTAEQFDLPDSEDLIYLSDVTSISEAARSIGVTPMTVWNWVEDNRIKCKRLGRCTLVLMSEVKALDSYIREHYPVKRTFQLGYRASTPTRSPHTVPPSPQHSNGNHPQRPTGTD